MGVDIWGDKLKLAVFGESHGPMIGGVISGLPAGLIIDEEGIRADMKRRAPGLSPMSSQRKEPDEAKILSGAFNGRTTGSALAFEIANADVDSSSYSPNAPRPSHADYTAYMRYGGYNDYRGGGHFSGRLTAPIVFAGAIAKARLKDLGIEVAAKIERIGQASDTSLTDTEFLSARQKPFGVYSDEALIKMQSIVESARSEGDSIGGVVEARAFGVRAGLGDPMFEGFESVASSLIFAIPACKGVSFGEGFGFASMKGSEANDEMAYSGNGEPIFLSNHNGGILGGITNGEAISLKAVFKPTPSIAKAQRTINLESKENIIIETKGRHDPSIVPRAVVVVEAALAFSLLSFLI